METCANTQQQQQQLIKETEIEARVSMAKPPLKKKRLFSPANWTCI